MAGGSACRCLANRLISATKTSCISPNRYGTNRWIPPAHMQCTRSLHVTSRGPAIYHEGYLEPIVDKDLIPTQKQHMGERVYLPVKAMKTVDKFTHYHDPLLEQFINSCMTDGCRITAKNVVAKAFEKIKLIQLNKYYQATNDAERQAIICDPIRIFHKAFENVRPVFKFRRFIKGGTIYLVPVAATPDESKHTAFCWIRDSSKNKDKKVRIWDSMANELLDASENVGQSVRRKQDLHRQCDQNKAYAHFIWSK